MRYAVKPTAQFRQDYRRAMRRGEDMGPLDGVIAALAEGETLPRENRDRALTGRWSGYRECRVGDNRFLVYRMDGENLVLTLTRTGNRADLYHKGGVNAMKKSTSLRMLLRSPVKTAVTLLLIAAASFLFLYNLLDYAMTKREYDRTYSAYHGYFSLRSPEAQIHNDLWGLASRPYFFVSDEEANPAYDPERYAYENYHQPDVEAGTVEQVLALPYVEYASPRYMTAGLSAYKRIFTYCLDWDLAFYDYGDRLVVEGTLEGITPCEDPNSFVMRGDGYSLALTLGDVKVLAGEEEDLRKSHFYTEKHKLNVAACVLTAEEPKGILYATGGQLEGQRYMAAFCKNTFTPEDVDELEPGRRYVACIVTKPSMYSSYNDGLNPDTWLMEKNPDARTRLSSTLNYPYAYFADDTIYGVWPYLYSLEGQPENYLETEEFAPLRKIMQVMETDEYTLDVHYTEDMGNIRRYLDGKLLPVQGRMLAPEDTENRDPVCVIPDTFAEKYGLSLGDTLHLELGDKLLEQYAPMGAIAYSAERYAENWTGQDFTVVGTYAEMGLDKLADEDQYWAYGENAVFVPLSFLPETADVEDHQFKPSELSFVIPEADDILPFMEECIPQLEAMGWKVYFFDGNWPAVSEQLHQAGSLSMVKLGAFALSAVLVLWLTVYLYILRKKKEFAVMRALGCPTREAQKALLFPLIALAVPAVL
ncbi:MAG: type II toxin-antitoxin system YafQ family toxin, partial [Oscillospiraceae bacterium]|nr:type II toxin-antitoxin system YafQ family toxin [Oscillospiraceae bacterium]